MFNISPTLPEKNRNNGLNVVSPINEDRASPNPDDGGNNEEIDAEIEKE